MNYLKNHCCCKESNWGGSYTGMIMVSLNEYEEENKKDWENIIEEYAYNCKEKEKKIKEYFDKKGHKYGNTEESGEVLTIRLKPEVMKWLRENVKDTKEGKGWCIGSESYIAMNPSAFTIFFKYRRDALKFIKEWSEWKKPVSYCQYYTEVRKKLNLETLKYEKY